jgi:hypothetical protein
MNRYNTNKSGFYPEYSSCKKTQVNVEDVLNVILYILTSKKKIRDLRIRTLVNDVFEYLERIEGFHFGLSEEVEKLIVKGAISFKNVTLDHGVPSTVLMNHLKVAGITTTADLLNFFRKHYYMCFISKEEDTRLNKNKLKQKMPDNWKNDWTKWDARYKAIDIKLVVSPGI